MSKQLACIRWMLRKDLSQVLAVEEATFDCPWTEADFIRTLRHRNCIGMVAERDCRVSGYMVYELDKTRTNLLNLAVHPALQCQGIGRLMIDKLKSKLSEQRRREITVNIRESNLGAQIFFRTLGFRAVRILPKPYDNTDENAIAFRFEHQAQTKVPCAWSQKDKAKR